MTEFERREADWLAVDEAVRRLLDAVRPTSIEEVPFEDGAGRVLGRDLRARATLPPWDNSAMDGYAVRSADLDHASPEHPVRLRVVGEIRAGDLPARAVEPGEAVRIMTGAPVPPGADSVVRVEDTDAEDEEEGVVRVLSQRDRDRNIRPGGRDMEAGDTVLRAGTVLTPGAVAVAAALGHAVLSVFERPRIAVLSSGDELRGMDRFEDVIEGRGVPETNGPGLVAGLRGCGAEPVFLGAARDDASELRRRVREASGADALVTSGGASMGEADLFKRVLEEEGLEVDFWRVRIRPGSPFSLAHLPRTEASEPASRLPVLGLPGNPSSAFVTFQLFVRPFVLALGGHRDVHRRVVRAVAAERLPSVEHLAHFHRVELEDDGSGGLRARLTGPQSSGLVGGLARADGLGVVPEGRDGLDEGEPLEVILLDDAPGVRRDPGYGARGA